MAKELLVSKYGSELPEQEPLDNLALNQHAVIGQSVDSEFPKISFQSVEDDDG